MRERCPEKLESIERRNRRFAHALHSTTMPDYVLDAVSSTMSVLKTPTCIRLPDGSFYGREGLHSTAGSCEGSCEHVWNYAYALPFLFPRLERSLRETSYRYNLDEFGGLHFRTMIPLGRPFSPFRPCVDGQLGAIMKVYREWFTGSGALVRNYTDSAFPVWNPYCRLRSGTLVRGNQFDTTRFVCARG